MGGARGSDRVSLARWLSLVVVLLWTADASGQDGAPPPRALRPALEATTRYSGASTGILILRNDTVGHVLVGGDEDWGPPKLGTRSAKRDVGFHQGTPKELTLDAKGVQWDRPAGVPLRVVRVNSDLLPPPLHIDPTQRAVEGQRGYVLGWVQGQKRVTTTAVTLSQVRNDPAGGIHALLTGPEQAYPTMGPVVDEDGGFLGLAEVSDKGRGVLLPSGFLAGFLQGRVVDQGVEPTRNAGGELELRVETSIVDPLRRIARASVLLTPVSPEVRVQDAAGRWCRPSTGCVEVPLTVVAIPDRRHVRFQDGRTFSTHRGAVSVFGTAALRGTKSDEDVWVQIELVGKDGKKRVSAPRLEHLHFQNRAAPPALPVRKRWLTQSRPRESRGGRLAMPVGQPLRGAPLNLVGAQATPLRLRRLARNSLGGIPPCMAWGPQGRAFYLSDGNGNLRRIAAPSLVETARLRIGAACSGIAASAEGIVVAVGDRGELWVVDPQTLSLLKRITVGPLAINYALLAATPTSHVAWVLLHRGAVGEVDLKAGVMRAVHSSDPNGIGEAPAPQRHQLKGLRGGGSALALSHDGTQLLLVSSSGAARYRVGENGLELAQSVSPFPRPNGYPYRLSSDSALLGVTRSRAFHRYGDLSAPPRSIEREGAFASFGGERGGFYACSGEGWVWSSLDGEASQVVRFPPSPHRADIRQLLVDAKGTAAISLSPQHLFYLEFTP